MRFYYFSIFSWMLYGTFVVITLVLLWALWTKILRLKIANPVYWVLVAAVLVVPWVEELWIAYNFDGLCRKDAGVFVNKTVEVDGYYNHTGADMTRIIEPPYKFIETPTRNGKYRRIEHGTADERLSAIAQYEKNKGKKPGEREWFSQPIREGVQVTVEMDTGNVWRITNLDKPTARYQYRALNSHSPVAHQITRFEDTVTDAQTGEVLGRYVNYYRGSYWFFISLSAPTIPCRETQAGTRQHGSLIYRAVLRPSK